MHNHDKDNNLDSVRIYINKDGCTHCRRDGPFYDSKLTTTLKAHDAKGQYIFFGTTTIEQRQAFEAVFPLCAQIIVIGLPYDSKNELQPTRPFQCTGFISNMAWAYDYHDVVLDKLEGLSHYLKGQFDDLEVCLQVDTGPLVDRHIGLRAGLGSYGRNQCLLNDRYGTEFYIGYLLMSQPIIAPVSNNALPMHSSHCSGCRACVDACPARALHLDYSFDGQRCISYLTQKKDHLTWAERQLIGQNVYGCDICQLVCPKNQRKKLIPEAYQRQTSNKIDLVELLSLSNKALTRTYKSSGFIWRGAKVLKRNAIIGLGNTGDRQFISVLLTLLNEANDYHMPYILWALYRCGDQEIALRCKKILLTHQDEIVKKECQMILQRIK